MPWLMLPFDDKEETSRSFYSILENTVYHLDLPEARAKEFRGSSYGWVVTVEKGPELNLFNPLSKVRIALPPIYTFPNIRLYSASKAGREYVIVDRDGRTTRPWCQTNVLKIYIQKLVLSSPPHDDYLAIAIYDDFSRLAFCTSNDKKWTAAETKHFGFGDVIFYEDKIYALRKDGELVVSDLSSLPKFKHVPVKLPHSLRREPFKLYLVGSSSGLMMVARVYEKEDIDDHPDYGDRLSYKTIKFKIYLLKSYSSAKRLRWTKVTTLGDNVMFLGYNTSVLISCLALPKLRNCVYYTDDAIVLHDANEYGGFDIGAFDLEEGCVKEFKELNLSNEMVWPPPVWVMPNP